MKQVVLKQADNGGFWVEATSTETDTQKPCNIVVKEVSASFITLDETVGWLTLFFEGKLDKPDERLALIVRGKPDVDKVKVNMRRLVGK